MKDVPALVSRVHGGKSGPEMPLLFDAAVQR